MIGWLAQLHEDRSQHGGRAGICYGWCRPSQGNNNNNNNNNNNHYHHEDLSPRDKSSVVRIYRPDENEIAMGAAAD